MGLIINDWKHFLRTETSQKYLLKTLYFNKKDTRKVKDFQKFSNKKICLILQSNSTKHKKPFKFISWSNFLERYHILSHEIQGKRFIDWFDKLSDGYIFSNHAIHRMGNEPNILGQKCKEREESHPILYSVASCPKLLQTSSMNFPI